MMAKALLPWVAVLLVVGSALAATASPAGATLRSGRSGARNRMVTAVQSRVIRRDHYVTFTHNPTAKERGEAARVMAAKPLSRYVAGHTFVVHTTPTRAMNAVASLPFVSETRAVPARHKVDSAIRHPSPMRPYAISGLSVLAASEAAAGDVERVLGKRVRRDKTVAPGGVSLFLELEDGPARSSDRVKSVAMRLARLPGVHYVGHYGERVESNAYAHTIIQSGRGHRATPKAPPAAWAHGLTGEGEVVMISDTGLDVESCYFSDPDGSVPYDRVDLHSHRKVVTYFTSSDDEKGRTDRENGHGTHVSGTALGKATSDHAGEYNGLAHESKVAFVDLNPSLDARASVVTKGLMEKMETIYEEAGARIHSMSWGAAVNRYDVEAREMDGFVHANRDMVLIAAAGNDGRDRLCSPGTAKNMITVGASSNSKDAFEDMLESLPPSAARRNVHGLQLKEAPHLYSHENLWSYSSHGPTPDGRLKPDVVAPGDPIISARSATGAAQRGCQVRHECRCNREGGDCQYDSELGQYRCVCKEGYCGVECSHKVPPSSTAWTEEAVKCPHGCNGHGRCEYTGGFSKTFQCKCDEGWCGNDCTIRSDDLDCPQNCNGHGSCDRSTGTCQCEEGWCGALCSIRYEEGEDGAADKCCPTPISWKERCPECDVKLGLERYKDREACRHGKCAVALHAGSEKEYYRCECPNTSGRGESCGEIIPDPAVEKCCGDCGAGRNTYVQCNAPFRDRPNAFMCQCDKNNLDSKELNVWGNNNAMQLWGGRQCSKRNGLYDRLLEVGEACCPDSCGSHGKCVIRGTFEDTERRRCECSHMFEGERCDRHEYAELGVVTMGGTSMATPLVAGAASLIREYFRKGFYPSGRQNEADSKVPSSALVRAIVAHSAVPLTGVVVKHTFAVHDYYRRRDFGVGQDHREENKMQEDSPTIPDAAQGHGRVWLDGVLRFDDGDTVRPFSDEASPAPGGLYVLDENDHEGGGLGEHGAFVMCVRVSAPGRVTSTLAWTDPPADSLAAKALVNDLDLKMVAGRLEVAGNCHIDGMCAEDRDASNNLEKASVEVDGGVVSISVRARRVNLPGMGDSEALTQPFALVVSSDSRLEVLDRALCAECVPGVSPPVQCGLEDSHAEEGRSECGDDGRYGECVATRCSQPYEPRGGPQCWFSEPVFQMQVAGAIANLKTYCAEWCKDLDPKRCKCTAMVGDANIVNEDGPTKRIDATDLCMRIGKTYGRTIPIFGKAKSVVVSECIAASKRTT